MTRLLIVAPLALAASILAPGARMLAQAIPTGAVAGDSDGRPSFEPGRQNNSDLRLALATPIPADQEGVGTRTHRQLYESLAREYDDARKQYMSAVESFKTRDEFEDAQKKKPDREEYARRFLLLAQSHSQDPVAVNAINWTFTVGGIDSGPTAEKAVDLLIKDHLNRGQFGPVCRDLAFIANRNAERLFRSALEKSEDREVRGWSSFGLAQRLLVQIESGQAADSKRAFEEAEGLYQKAGEAYGDLKFPSKLWQNLVGRTDRVTGVGHAIASGHNTLADFTKVKLMVLRADRDLVVGRPAYEIEGEDLDGKPMKLSDHRGQVVVLVFFVSGDRPFLDLLPHLQELVGRMEGKPFALLGIIGELDRNEFKGFAAGERIKWRCWHDGGKIAVPKDAPIADRWDIRSWPMIYVLDQHGVIRYKNIAGQQLGNAVTVLMKKLGAPKAGTGQ